MIQLYTATLTHSPTYYTRTKAFTGVVAPWIVYDIQFSHDNSIFQEKSVKDRDSFSPVYI